MTYHIGEHIKAEMQRQGLKAEQLAELLCINRTSVYDIFNRGHIATDQLARIGEILHHDFFADLSAIHFSANTPAAWTVAETPELTVCEQSQVYEKVVKGYLERETAKPLVLFYALDGGFKTAELLDMLVEKSEGVNFDASTPLFEALPVRNWNPPQRIWNDIHYVSWNYFVDDSGKYQPGFAIQTARQTLRENDGHLILLMPVWNGISRGKHVGLVYDDIAEDCFHRWGMIAEFAVVYKQGSNYPLVREYYRAYLGDGCLERVARRFKDTDSFEKELLDMAFGDDCIGVEELMPEDETGLTRICLSLPRPEGDMADMLFDNGVNNHPNLEMWIDVRNDYLVDYENREKPLTLRPTDIDSKRKGKGKSRKSIVNSQKDARVWDSAEDIEKWLEENLPEGESTDWSVDDYAGSGDYQPNGSSICDVTIIDFKFKNSNLEITERFIPMGGVDAIPQKRLTITNHKNISRLLKALEVKGASPIEGFFEITEKTAWPSLGPLVNILKAEDIAFNVTDLS